MSVILPFRGKGCTVNAHCVLLRQFYFYKGLTFVTLTVDNSYGL